MPAGYAPRPPSGVPGTAGRPPSDTDRRLLALVRGARGDRRSVVLEGVHAVKHAVRFATGLTAVASPDRDGLARLLGEVAPDVAAEILAQVEEVSASTWVQLAPRGTPSPVLAVTSRPQVAAGDVLAAAGPVLILEHPRHLGNVGAVIRVAAAAGIAGVLVVGDADPYHPTAVRGAAGLQFALSVARSDEVPETTRRIVALDGGGRPVRAGDVGDDVALAVGTERAGLSEALRSRAVARVAVPMRPGVSSLNLATAVAVAVYAGR